jgi:hypothetical protein
LKTIAIVFLLAVSSSSGADSIDNAVIQAKTAGIADREIIAFLALSVDKDIPGTDAATILDAVVEAVRDGFSSTPYWEKIKEGVGKRVPPNRVAMALEKLLETHRFIRETAERCRQGSSSELGREETLSMLTGRIELGLSPEALNRIICHSEAAPLSDCAVAAEMKALLMQIGFREPAVDGLVHTGLTNGTLSAEWRKFPVMASIAVSRGLPADKVIVSAGRSLSENGNIKLLLSDLDFTGRNLGNGPFSKPLAPSSENDREPHLQIMP